MILVGIFWVMLVLLRDLGRIIVSFVLFKLCCGMQQQPVFCDEVLHVDRVQIRNLFILYMSIISEFIISLYYSK